MARVIVLVGRKNSGKTLAAQLLRDQGLPHHPVAIAGLLKQMAAMVFPEFTQQDLHGDDEFKEAVSPELGHSARDVLRALGGVFRVDLPRRLPHLPRNLLLRSVLARARIGEYLIITDCRMLAEVEAIKAACKETLVVGIVRQEAEEQGDEHPTEREVPLVIEQHADMVFYNDGTIEDLRASLRKDILDVFF